MNQAARYTNEPRVSNKITHGDKVEIATQQYSCDSCRKPDTLLRKQTLSQFLPLLRLNPPCPPELVAGRIILSSIIFERKRKLSKYRLL